MLRCTRYKVQRKQEERRYSYGTSLFKINVKACEMKTANGRKKKSYNNSQFKTDINVYDIKTEGKKEGKFITIRPGYY